MGRIYRSELVSALRLDKDAYNDCQHIAERNFADWVHSLRCDQAKWSEYLLHTWMDLGFVSFDYCRLALVKSCLVLFEETQT